jgi:hypothetical protein
MEIEGWKLGGWAPVLGMLGMIVVLLAICGGLAWVTLIGFR